MKHTNKYGMPYVYDKMIRRLATRYGYIPRSARPSFSVTSLGGSAYRYKLARLHDDELEEDVLDVFFAFRGQMMHKALEDVSLQNVIPELSLGLELDGVWLSGRIDTILPGVIEDYKMRTVEAMWFHSDDDVQELARQLNPYNYMLFKTFGLFMPRLVGHILFMNWVGSRAKYEKGYPNKPHFEINVPVWTIEQTEEYLRERIRLFLLPIEELPSVPRRSDGSARRHGLSSVPVERRRSAFSTRRAMRLPGWNGGSFPRIPGIQSRVVRAWTHDVCLTVMSANSALTGRRNMRSKRTRRGRTIFPSRKRAPPAQPAPLPRQIIPCRSPCHSLKR